MTRGRLSRPSLHQPESCRELRRDHCVLPNKVVIEGVKAAGSEEASPEFDTAV